MTIDAVRILSNDLVTHVGTESSSRDLLWYMKAKPAADSTSNDEETFNENKFAYQVRNIYRPLWRHCSGVAIITLKLIEY
jgi:hypothetical protein